MAGPAAEVTGFLNDQGILYISLIENGNGWRAVRVDHDRISPYTNIEPVTVSQMSAMLQASPIHDKTRAFMALERETSDPSAIDPNARRKPKPSVVMSGKGKGKGNP